MTDEDVVYTQIDWRGRLAGTPLWKRAMYRPARPLLSMLTRRHLGPEYRHRALRYVLPIRGLPLEARRAWANHHRRIKGATVLVQGTGTGWDVVSWARYGPAQIQAMDLYPFDEWPEVATHVGNRHGVEVIFSQSPLENVPLPDESVDLVVSDAVYEHCRDLTAVLKESRRVLRPDGIVYAGYGPLWYCAGGDHFSGRGGPSTVFNHVRLSAADYRAYFEAERQPEEDFQSGGRYVELDLFSKLTTREYLAAFDGAGFEVESLILEIADNALAYRRAYRREFDQMVAAHPGRTVDDFLVKANLVILRVRQ